MNVKVILTGFAMVAMLASCCGQKKKAAEAEDSANVITIFFLIYHLEQETLQ